MTPITTAAHLGAAIAAARKAQKLSQQDLAARTGIRQGTISEVERGKATAHLGKVLQLLAALGLDVVISNRQGKAAASPSATIDIVIDEPIPDASIDIDAIVAPRKRPGR
jgi:HTH-type transcriptional regulator/antitoxin HipB